jgi:2-polyprenyl-3-methyl-5-hydroxy-6-metoxy-1,4-benzoquinol methylase
MWDEIYGEEYYTNGYLALRKVYRPLIRNVLRKKLSSYCRPGMRVLDVGAGLGFWMEELQSLGCHVEGLEPSVAARRMLQTKFTVAADWTNVRDDWDLILLMDVIGHIADPGRTLDEIVRRLRPRAKLIIRLPNFDGHWRKCQIWRAYLRNESPFGIPDILWHFNRRDLAAWLPTKGLQILHECREIQLWADGGWKTRLLRWGCAVWDFVTRNGDELYIVIAKN